jgi:hypothetical protein
MRNCDPATVLRRDKIWEIELHFVQSETGEEIEKLGNWETGKLGNWETRKMILELAFK